MKRRWLLILIGANLLVLLALAFIYPNFMVAPGPLMQAHADLATHCFACHSPWQGASSERCLSCHKSPDIGLRTTQGVPLAPSQMRLSFHQELTEQNCMACHSDHEAPKLARSERKTFSHSLLNPAVRNDCASCHIPPANDIHRDLDVNCSQCHKPDRWKPASFDHALLAADMKAHCESCHQAPRDRQHSEITGNCQQCHSPAHWKPSTFDHAKLFLLEGEHKTQCTTCHIGNDYSRYTCYGCHEHQPDRIRAKHQKEGIREFDNCVECHRSAEENEEGHDREGSERD